MYLALDSCTLPHTVTGPLEVQTFKLRSVGENTSRKLPLLREVKIDDLRVLPLFGCPRIMVPNRTQNTVTCR